MDHLEQGYGEEQENEQSQMEQDDYGQEGYNEQQDQQDSPGQGQEESCNTIHHFY